MNHNLLLFLAVAAAVAVVDSKYTFNVENLSWPEAYEKCRVDKSRLAVVASKDDVEALLAFAEDSGATQLLLHVGAHARYTPGLFVTLKGQPVNETGFDVWADGAPFETPDLVYVMLDASVTPELINVDVDATSQSVCEVTGDDYESIPEFGFYKYHVDPATWSVAWATCRSEGAALWIVNSPEELAAVHAKFGYNRAWVGVHQRFGSGDFVTVDNIPLSATGYNVWSYQALDGDLFPFVSADRNIGLSSETIDYTTSFVCELILD